MSLRVKVVALMGGLLLSLAAARVVQAADQQTLIDQISALTKSAFTAYSDGDLDKAKGQLLQAIALSKKDGELGTHPLLARTYLLLGVVYVDGFEDRKKGIANFSKALKITSDIQIPEALATKTVKKAFAEAGGEKGASPADNSEAVASDTGGDAKPAKEDKRKSAREDKDENDQAAREAKEAREAAIETAKAVLMERKQAEAEARQHDKEAREEKQQSEKALAQAKTREEKERAEKERLQKEKEEKESQIAEAKGVLTDAKQRLQQLEKDKADRDKQIAAGNERERKEREAKEKLQAEKVEKDRLLAEKDKLIAEAKQQLQQAQKDKADKDKLIAAGNDREKKEREAKEKLEREKQASDAREKERRAQEEATRTDREKLAAGPDLPGHISEQIYCALPDEVPSGTDLYVHCLAQPSVKVKEIALYYRPSGVAHYNSLTLERSKKGWYSAVVPGTHVTGKLLQYYVEARDGRETVTGTNGKAQSPNILTLRAQKSSLVAGASSDSSFTPASASGGKRSGRAARDKGR